MTGHLQRLIFIYEQNVHYIHIVTKFIKVDAKDTNHSSKGFLKIIKVFG